MRALTSTIKSKQNGGVLMMTLGGIGGPLGRAFGGKGDYELEIQKVAQS